jgi:hypothetical protein
MVPRTGGNACAAKVWGSSIVQGPFSVAPCQTRTLRFATFASLYAATLNETSCTRSTQWNGSRYDRSTSDMGLYPSSYQALVFKPAATWGRVAHTPAESRGGDDGQVPPLGESERERETRLCGARA